MHMHLSRQKERLQASSCSKEIACGSMTTMEEALKIHADVAGCSSCLLSSVRGVLVYIGYIAGALGDLGKDNMGVGY
jgi:hypothetical protein